MDITKHCVYLFYLCNVHDVCTNELQYCSSGFCTFFKEQRSDKKNKKI